jgi:hypothetical protein
MMLSLALTLQLISSAGECYYVGNTRIVVLPSCDFSPAEMARLEAEEPPPTKAQVEEERRRRAYDVRRSSAEQQRRAPAPR